MLSDLEIAQKADIKPICEIAKKLDLNEDDLELYGKYKAKVNVDGLKKEENAKVILVTAISPTRPRCPQIPSGRFSPCRASSGPRPRS